jgi:hypothetical protein
VVAEAEAEEISKIAHRDKWCKATGNVPNAEQKSQKCLSNHPLIVRSIAENAGEIKIQDLEDKTKAPLRGRFCFMLFLYLLHLPYNFFSCRNFHVSFGDNAPAVQKQTHCPYH